MLHIISPTHSTTSSSLFGLMRLTIRQLNQEDHEVILIGTAEEEAQYRIQGVPILGSIGGVADISRTLANRLSNYIQENRGSQITNIMAWGWHAMSLTEECSHTYETCAFVDEIDFAKLGNGSWRVIPTTDLVLKNESLLGVPSAQIVEPLVGIEPSTFTLDREYVLEECAIEQGDLFVSIVGDVGSWQDIVAMAVRLKIANQRGVFVLPSTYRDRALLEHAAKSNGVDEMICELPTSIRQLDVIRQADCAWCPSPATFDYSLNVLDVLSAAWEETPLACSCEHPVASLPTIGPHIAWAMDEIEIFGWLLDIASNPIQFEETSAQRAATVRAFASPIRFIESLQMRMHEFV